MKIVAIVQARMGSARLPGKVLLDLCGTSVLARVASRVRLCRLIDEVMIAITTSPADEAIVEEAQRLAVAIFRGDEQDVCQRLEGRCNFTWRDVELMQRHPELAEINRRISQKALHEG
jgi:spore coat polysaccharide biosynthesis protein SpsF (cytidylyltransferase family)